MTNTGRKPQRRSAKIKTALRSTEYSLKETTLVILCVLSLFSEFADIPLAGLALIYIQLCKNKGSKYICSFASVAYFISTVTQTAFYIPYIAFVFLYIIGDYLLENHSIKPVYPAVLVFAVTKGYVLSFGYEMVYWLYLAAETIAIICAPAAIETGFDILKNNEEVQSGQNLAEVFVALVIIALATDGVHIWGVYFSVAFLLGTACLYGKKLNFTVSFTAVFAMFLTLCPDNNFAILAAGFAVIYCGGLFFTSKGITGYALFMVLSVAVAAITIWRFNSLVFVSTSAVAGAVCFCGDKLLGNIVKTTVDNDNLLGEKDYYELKNKLEKLNRCFRFLGNTVVDISNLLSKEYIPTPLTDSVATEICRKCKNNTLCWQEHYSDTQKQFSAYEYSLQKNITKEFEGGILNRCDKIPQIKQSFEQHNRLNITQKLIHSQGVHNQKILQNQFLAMAGILQEISYQSSLTGVANTAFTHKANSFLASMNKRVNYCICYQNKNKCIISTRQLFTPDESYRFKSKLEAIYNAKFNLPTKECDGENTIYTFVQVPIFGCETGIKSVSRFKNCGDVWDCFTVDEYAYIILADGMGTGSLAHAEGKTVAVMLKSLLTASVKTETALELVNTALNLKGTGQSCVALDILKINLYNGQCSLYKAGAAETVVVDARKCEYLYKDSLPIGILRDTKISVMNFILNNGDTVILSTDGVNLQNKNIEKIKLIKEKSSAQSIAEYIMQNNDTTDDATVAVIKLLRV